MSKLKLYIISANMLLVLGFFFFNIIKNESVLNDGKTVLLELRPVDPRSLMQGDYMALRFSLGDQIGHRTRWDITKDFEDIISNDGETGKYCVARLDDNNVGHFVRLTDSVNGLHENEILLRYEIGKSTWEKYVYFGSDSYFFQEGTGDKYAHARYGMFKVATKGGLIGTCNLVGLCGEDKQLIK